MDIPQRHNPDTLLRHILGVALRSSFKSREQICDELSIRLERKISTNMLDNWTSESKRAWRLPAECVPALCEILGDDTMQRQLLSEPMRQTMNLGKWVMESAWVLDMVSVKVKKDGRKLLRISKVFGREIERRRRG